MKQRIFKTMLAGVCAVLLFSAAFHTAAEGQETMEKGEVLTGEEIRTGMDAPSITFVDSQDRVQQIDTVFKGRYVLMVFTGAKSCIGKDSEMVQTAEEFYQEGALAYIVEVIGSKEGCDKEQKDCVLRRSVPSANLLTLCDVSGEAYKKYSAGQEKSLFLINPVGTVAKTAPLSELSAMLQLTAHQAADLEGRIMETFGIFGD
jgi:peroxiredoxin